LEQTAVEEGVMMASLVDIPRQEAVPAAPEAVDFKPAPALAEMSTPAPVEVPPLVLEAPPQPAPITSRSAHVPASRPSAPVSAKPVNAVATSREASSPTQKASPATRSGGVAREGGSREARPLVARNAAPRYPEFARSKGWQGVVLVRVTVRPDGRAGAVVLYRSSGYSVLDAAALEAVHRWVFTPRLASGIPVESTIEVPVTFSLRRT
jgi:protein TonB